MYKYETEAELEKLMQTKLAMMYSNLKEKCKAELFELENFGLLPTSHYIQYVQLYEEREEPAIKICVTVLQNFTVRICVNTKPLPKCHTLWSAVPDPCNTILKLRELLHVISAFSVCPGNPDSTFQTLQEKYMHKDKYITAGYFDDIGYMTIRSSSCALLIKNPRCQNCCLHRKTLNKCLSRKMTKIDTPRKNWIGSTNGNSRMTSSQKIEKLRQLRTFASSLKSEVERLKKKVKQSFETECISLTAADSLDLKNMMDVTEKEILEAFPEKDSIQRLFWAQQKKYLKLVNKRNMKWHPMIIKWCLFMKSKSSSTYDAVRKAGFIHLPSERTLQDYTNIFTRGTGFHNDIICHLGQEVNDLTMKHERIVGILHDEMKIRSDLVYDKKSGQLVGFIDLGKTGNCLSNIQQHLKKEEKAVAKYVLVIMVRGLSTKIKFPLAHFATNGIVADQLFSILWKAVEILEVDLDLNVLFITGDGASPNRRFIRLHEGDGNQSVVHHAENAFSEESRAIYFISDPPHLMKTTRNNFSNSFAHNKTKKLWKNGEHISWQCIVDLYEKHCTGLYRLCPKLSKDHTNLTSYSYMKVNLAVQILSETVANALELTSRNTTKETVKFIRHMNKFFDIMNTRNFKESLKKKNENVKPFTSPDDHRLRYLTKEFLPYFTEWQRTVDLRAGNFTKSERSEMILSYQTIEGLKITVLSVVECIKYCLNNGMPFVLTEKFNQDAIEQHFGCHRASSGSNSNPSLHQFNSSMQKLRIIGSQAMAPLRGNTKRRLQLHVDPTALPKRPRR